MALDTGEVMAQLGLSGDLTTGEVRAARRRLAKRFHPDRAGPAAQRAMAEINEACDRLIASIRARRSAPPAPERPPTAHRAPPAPTAPTGRRRPTTTVQPVDVVRTVIVMVVAVAAVLLVTRSAGAVAVASALLVGALVAGAFVGVTWWLAKRS